MTGVQTCALPISLFVNPNVLDNSGDLRLQFAITPLPNESNLKNSKENKKNINIVEDLEKLNFKELPYIAMRTNLYIK